MRLMFNLVAAPVPVPGQAIRWRGGGVVVSLTTLCSVLAATGFVA